MFTGLHLALRLVKYALIIRRSGLFDAEFYRSQCPGERLARWTPILHYLLRGTADGLDPSPFFDTSFYAEQYPDVAARGKNPFVHFIRRGSREGRAPSARFEVADYLARHRPPADPVEDPPSPQAAKRPYLARLRLDAAMRSGLDRASQLADASRACRILVADGRVPTPDRDSASVRMTAILKLLRRLGHEVTFVANSRRARFRDGRALRALGVEMHLGFEDAARHLAARGHEYGVALLSTPDAADRFLMLVRAHALRAKVIYDTVDVHWLRLERAARVTGDARAAAEAARYRRLERLAVTSADLTLTVTAADREALLREMPDARVEILPNIHACPPGATRPAQGRRDLVFVGSFCHPPNADAVEWFADAILPSLQRCQPGLVLRVVGADVPRRIRRLAPSSVKVLGHVADLAPVLDASRVFVAPLRFGAGMKGKIGQSMSHGLPVVTTSVGAEGMFLVDGENALVADAPEAFAHAVDRLVRDDALWTRLSRSGTQLVRQLFSEDAALARLAALFPVARAESLPAPEPVPVLARLRS